MNAIKPFKRNDWGIFYKVAAASEIDGAFIKSLDWPEKICLGIIFKPLPLNRAAKLKFKTFEKYRMSFSCTSRGKRLRKIYPLVPSVGIESRPPENLTELKKIQGMMVKALAAKRKSGLDKNLKKALDEYSRTLLEKTESLVIMREGRPAGLFSLLHSVRILDNPVSVLIHAG